MTDNARVQHYLDANNEHRARIIAANGEILFVSSEGYKRPSMAAHHVAARQGALRAGAFPRNYLVTARPGLEKQRQSEDLASKRDLKATKRKAASARANRPARAWRSDRDGTPA
jgi:uncharacterized protein YegP (UPF0339 family)